MPTFGRREIFTNEAAIDSQNIVDVLEKAVSIHAQNEAEIRHLRNVYKGKQGILDRVKMSDLR